MLLPIYLDDLVDAERALAYSFRTVSYGHPGDADVHYLTRSFAAECDEQVNQLVAVASRYKASLEPDPERLHARPLTRARTGPLGLLRDLQEIHAIANSVALTCSMVRQAGMALNDPQVIDVVGTCRERTQAQLDWLRTQLDKAAPQALIIG